MDRPQSKTVTLKDICITEELSARSPRPADWQAEARAMQTLARQLAADSPTILQSLVKIARDLCQASTAAISLLETTDNGQEVWRWIALAGTLAPQADRAIPRNFSPWDVCLDRAAPQLFSHPERYFTYLQELNAPIVESLVLPLMAGSQALGTIWIVSHDDNRHFDSEDVRVMATLADFAAVALQQQGRQTEELPVQNARSQAETDDRQRLEEERQRSHEALRESEERLQIALKTGKLGSWELNLNDYTLISSDSCKANFGLAPEDELTYERLAQMIYPEDREAWQAAVTRAITEKIPFEADYRIRWTNGETHWINARGRTFYGEDGTPLRTIGVTQNITEWKIAENALRESEARFRAVTNLVPALLWRVDPIGQSITWNPRWQEYTGQTAREASNGGWLEAIHPADRPNTGRVFAAAYAAQCELEVRHRLRRHDGEYRWFLVRQLPIKDDRGTVVQWFGAAIDIHDQQVAIEALHASEEKLRNFVSATSDIIYEMSADWREMLFLKGKEFVATTENPRLDWTEVYIPEGEKSRVWEAIDRAIETHSNFELEYRVIRLDGTVGWTFSRAIPLLGETGEIVKWFGAASDITEQKQAEVALRESEAKYRSLFNSIDEGFHIIELIDGEAGDVVDYRFLEGNPAFERLTGLKNTAGNLGSQIAPKTESHWLEAYDRVARTGEPLHIENYSEDTKRWYSAYASRVGGAGSRQVAIVFDDITDRKRHEANLAFLAEVSLDLARLTNIDDTMDAIGKKIGRFFGVKHCMFAEHADESETSIAAYGWHTEGAPDLRGTYRTRDYLSDELITALRAGKPFTVSETQQDARVNAENYGALGIRSFIIVPLVRMGEWRFQISIIDNKPRQWRDDEIELIRELTTRIWTWLERARAEAALRASEEKYRTLFNSIDEGFALVEVFPDERGCVTDLVYREANEAFERHSGMRDFIGKRVSEILPNLEQHWLDILTDIYQTGEPARMENYIAELGRWLNVHYSRVGDAGSRQVVVVFNNITDRKQAEEQLRRAAEMDAFRVKLTDALRALSDPLEIQRAAMRIVGEWLQVDRVLYSDITPDGKMWIARDNYTSGRLQKLIGSFPTASFSTSVETLKRGEVVIISNVEDATDLTEAEKALYEAHNTRSALGVPLVKDGRWLSNIGIHHAEPRHWTTEEITLVQETAERTWETVERARAEAAVEEDLRDTQMLHDLATRLVIEEDRQTLYQEIVKTAIALAQSDAGSFQFLDETTQELVLIATQGIDRTLAEHFYRLDASSNTSCGIALATGERTFINFDVPESEDPDGSLRMHKDAGLLSAQSTPLLSRSGKPIGMVSTHWREDRRLSDRELRFFDLLARQAADIIEQRQAEENRIQLIREQAARQEERQRVEALAELDRAKTRFFSNVSHEFRTPLTLILNPLEETLARLNSENDPRLDGDGRAARAPDLHRYLQESLQVAHRNSLRLLKLVNTLLDFSRIEADRLEATYEPTDLASYTIELASVFRSAIEHAGLQLIVNCPPLPEPVYVNPGMWEKIAINLLSNAFKFTFSGTIHVALDYKTDAVQLTVSDTGTGIPTSELPRLFERFYQVKGARGRSYEGSGIGLSLVQELVKLHGGSIGVTSTVGEGTSFTVTIPTGTAHLPGDRIAVAAGQASATVTTNAFVEEAMRWLPAEGNGAWGMGHGASAVGDREALSSLTPDAQVPTPGSARGHDPYYRILLADDNADMRDYLRRLLGSRYEVTAVADGAAALAAIRQAPPDLVLADVMMPEMDGFELLRSLRSDPQTRTIPIILLSARAGEESRVQGLETGADDYLIKPFSARELLARVDTHLQLARMRREVAYQERMMREVQAMNERLEQQVKARTAQLEAVNQELEAFAAAIAHDLRTPLRYINSFTDRLRVKLDALQVDASSLKSLDIIAQSALGAEKMVGDLLEFSRLGQTKMQLTTVIMDALVQQVRSQLQSEPLERSLHWHVEPLPAVTGDSVLLQIVLQNLLSNAIKYTAHRDPAEISIGSREREHEVIFFVKDNGAGFDMKYRDRLFTMFQRLHPQEQFTGTGVGLATVQRIIHRHGGRIWAESAIDRGATFYFSLPKV